MRQVAFFPWLQIPADKKVGRFNLIKFDRNTDISSDALIDADSLRKLISAYRITPEIVCDSVALLTLDEKKIGDSLTDEEVESLFSFSQMLACAALSARSYFVQKINYCARDNIILVVQNLPEGKYDGSSIRNNRRRDGWSATLITKSDYFELMPLHVGTNYQLEFNEKFLASLLEAYETLSHEAWANFSEAIYLFNLSNTDSDTIPRQSELVFLYCAFERILKADHSRADFEEKLMRVFAPRSEFLVPSPDSNNDLHHEFCATHAGQRAIQRWIKGFYIARANMAHGKINAQPDKFLPVHNHLLLATFLFPLICKRILANKKLYEWTHQDQAYVDVFEELIVFDHFKTRGIMEKQPWARLISLAERNASSAILHDAVRAVLEKPTETIS